MLNNADVTMPLFENYLYPGGLGEGQIMGHRQSVVPLANSGIGDLSLLTSEHTWERKEEHASVCLLAFLLFCRLVHDDIHQENKCVNA